MAKRVPRQAVLGFTRVERALNRQIAQRAAGLAVTPGLGRPSRKRDLLEGHLVPVSHRRRAAFDGTVAVHATLRCGDRVTSLRTPARLEMIKRAFAKANEKVGFRVTTYSVLGNHIHLVVEVDSQQALSKGMQTLALSISRSLNAQSVRRRGGSLDPRRGAWAKRPGWLGKVFSDRYYVHTLRSRTEIANAVHYVMNNAQKHYGRFASAQPVAAKRVGHDVDAFCSAAQPRDDKSLRRPTLWLLRTAVRDAGG